MTVLLPGSPCAPCLEQLPACRPPSDPNAAARVHRPIATLCRGRSSSDQRGGALPAPPDAIPEPVFHYNRWPSRPATA